jgi:TonB family protein
LNPEPRTPRRVRALTAPGFSGQPAFRIIGVLGARPILSQVMPNYPIWAEEQGITGNVKLAFRVNDQGNVSPNIWVTQTIGDPLFDDIAIRALRQWKFAPLDSPERWPELPNVLEDADHGQPGVIDFRFTIPRPAVQT